MSQNARESLSALMDDEGDELELRRVLKSLDDEPDAAEAWRRYHLMRSLMRRETDVDVATDLSAGVLARLEDEPIPSPGEASVPRRSLPLVRSAGIAAAVSLLVITGVQFYNGASPLGGGDTSMAASSTAASPDGGLVQEDSRMPSLVDLPMFQSPAEGNAGMMTVGAGDAMPMMLSPSQRQSLRMDSQQALLLQSYLDRHAEGAAASGGDVWMPLLRASGSETLGQR